MWRLKFKTRHTLISGIGLSSCFFAPLTQANECIIGERQFPVFEVKTEQQLSIADISISAQSVTIEKGNTSVFEGDVQIAQGDIAIQANKAEVNIEKGSIKADGPLHFTDGRVDIQADHLNADRDSTHAEVTNARYKFIEKFARGDASLLELDKGEGVTLHNGSFTTCPISDESWLIEANEINLSPDEEWGEAWHATIKVYDTPVFYLPYVTFSLTDKRKSGLLYPEFRSSNNSGLEIAQPYYWNIAENMDATFTPRYLSDRGNQLFTEFRYLQPQDGGIVNLEYMSSDDKLASDDERWLVNWAHKGKSGENWRYFIDYTKVSDDNYFVDLNTSLDVASAETELYQFAQVGYFTEAWDLEFKYRDFQVLGDHNDPYRGSPYVNFRYDQEVLSNTVFGVHSELAMFNNDAADLNDATRLHMEPYLKWSLYNPYARAEVESSFMYTYFDQDVDKNNPFGLDESTSRSMPKFRAYASLQFERPSSWGGKEMTQTLEPQVQYLYIPERDQSDIGLYDTVLLQDDFYGLYRDNRFSSYDRIANANQVTLGATTRILDNNNVERLRFSLGQIIYFEDSTTFFGDIESDIKSGESALASELFMQIGERWGLRNSFQYDTQNSTTLKTNTTLDWRMSDRQLVQLTHRYVPNVASEDIRQVGLLVSQPLDDKWHFVGSYHRDLDDSRSIEHYAGFQYESCCWALRVAVYREQNAQLDGFEGSLDERDEYDSGIMFNFVFSGLGSDGRASIDTMVDRGIFGYRRPFYLNN